MCWLLLYNSMNQPYRAPVELPVLYINFSLAICFTCGNACFKATLLICSTLSFPPCVQSLFICLHVYFCLENKFISIFLDSIYIHVNIQNLFFSFWLTSLCITGQSEWPSSKNLQAINTREGMEKKEPSCTVSGNVNWYSLYG